jgi:hypothetical protein
VIRCYASGVHYGTVAGHEGRQVTLTTARRLWAWDAGKDKTLGLNGVALYGLNKDRGRVKCDPAVPLIVLLDAIEIIPAADAAQASIESA